MLISANRIRPAFLASVTSADEAHVALSAGADVIDCKDPSTGALGALPAHLIRDIVARVGSKVCVSATIGDLPSDPSFMVRVAEKTAATGVHYVKAGFFGSDDPRAAISALGRARLGNAQLIAVLMADQSPNFEIVRDLAKNHFAGVMLDTANKSSGALPDILSQKKLEAFVALAKQHGLVAGLAGALRRHHIAQLAALHPDVLGFRGALCCDGRASALDVARIAGIRDEISAYAFADLDKQPQRHALRI
jgi:uncharacterized protein (UPF0264 family)